MKINGIEKKKKKNVRHLPTFNNPPGLYLERSWLFTNTVSAPPALSTIPLPDFPFSIVRIKTGIGSSIRTSYSISISISSSIRISSTRTTISSSSSRSNSRITVFGLGDDAGSARCS